MIIVIKQFCKILQGGLICYIIN